MIAMEGSSGIPAQAPTCSALMLAIMENTLSLGGWKGAWCYDREGRELWSYVHGGNCVTPVAISNNGYGVVADMSKFPVKALLVRN